MGSLFHCLNLTNWPSAYLRSTIWTRQLLFFLGFIFVAHFSFAQKELPEPASPPRLVNDFAGLLQPDQVTSLENKLVLFSDCTSNQVSIVIVETLGDYEVADFAQRLGQKWGIGKKERNNGILILVAKNDRKMTIQTGFGLEGVLPDHICARIIKDQMKPNFKAGNYYEGLNAATDEIIARTKGEYQADPVEKKGKGGFPWGLIVVALGILFFIFRNRGKGNNRGGGGFSDFTNAVGPFILLNALDSATRGGRSGGGGWGGSGGSSGGGGFGGFGGGSFGGGGASGDW